MGPPETLTGDVSLSRVYRVSPAFFSLALPVSPFSRIVCTFTIRRLRTTSSSSPRARPRISAGLAVLPSDAQFQDTVGSLEIRAALYDPALPGFAAAHPLLTEGVSR